MNFSFVKNLSKWAIAGISTVVMAGADMLFNSHKVTPAHAVLTTAFSAAVNFGVASAVHAYQKGLFFGRGNSGSAANDDVEPVAAPVVRQTAASSRPRRSTARYAH